MKTLSEYNVQELSIKKAKETNGGFLGFLAFVIGIVIGVGEIAENAGEAYAASQCED